MNRKKGIIILCSVLAVLLLAGGSVFVLSNRKGTEVLAKAENEYNREYNSFCGYEGHPDMTIDGVLDEEMWQNKKWFTNAYIGDVAGSMPTFRAVGFTTEYGVYFAAVVEDTNIVCNGQKEPGYNSTWSVNLAAYNVGDTVADSITKSFEINMKGAIEGTDQLVDRAIVVNGEINSGSTEGATLEMFIPWSVLAIDVSKGVPEEFGFMAGYRALLEGKETTRMLAQIHAGNVTVKDYCWCDADGYKTAEVEGSILGNSKFGYACSANWDVSRAAEGIVETSMGTERHTIFFNQEYGSDFIVETTMIPVGSLENAYPKAGIIFYGTDETYLSLLMNVKEVEDGPNGTKNFSNYTLYAIDNRVSAWHQVNLQSKYDRTRTNAATKEGATLTVVKYEGKFFYFIDGKFLLAEEYDFMDMDVIPGFYSVGADVIYKDYSCKTVEREDVVSYLNERGVYLVEAKNEGKGGTVTTSAVAIKNGNDYDISIVTKSGYEVSSLTVNGSEKLSDAKKNADGGVYSISGAKGNQEILVSFEKCDNSKTYEGSVTSGDESLEALFTLKGVTNKSLYYETDVTLKRGFSLKVPAGTYQVQISAAGYVTVEKTIRLSSDLTENFVMKRSSFPSTVKVNGATLTSSLSNWDRTEEAQGKVKASLTLDSKQKPLYFEATGSDFVLEASFAYTTEFKEGVSYQPDLMGGFIFNDGKNQAWIVVNRAGFTYTDWKRKTNLINYSALTYPNALSTTFALVKKGEDLYVYYDGKLAAQYAWSEIVPQIKAENEMALGLYMIADKTADLEVSNYSVRTGTAAADKYIASHVTVDTALSENPMFAETVTVNGTQIESATRVWDLSQIKDNIVNGSYALGTKGKPLYFSEVSNTALLQMKIEYTSEHAEGVDYQKDLMGGLMLSNGKSTGWLVVDWSGIVYTGWKRESNYLSASALTYPEKRPVNMTVAIKDDYIHVYFNDVFAFKKKVTRILSGYKSGSELALGLYMYTDKAADIRFSNISMTTEASAVNSYMEAHK